NVQRDWPTLCLRGSAYRDIGRKQVRHLKAGLGYADVMKLVVGKQWRRVTDCAVGAPQKPLRAPLLRWRQRRIVAGQPAIERRITGHDRALVGGQGVRDRDWGDVTVKHLGEVGGVKGACLWVLLASRAMAPGGEI